MPPKLPIRREPLSHAVEPTPADRVLWESLERADRDLLEELGLAADYLEAFPWDLSLQLPLSRRELLGQRAHGAESSERWASYWLAYGLFAGKMRLAVIQKLDEQTNDAESELIEFADLTPEVRLSAAQQLPELVRLLKAGLNERLHALQHAKMGISRTLNRLKQSDALRRQAPDTRFKES